MTPNKKIASSSRFVRSIRVSAFHDSMFRMMPERYPGILVRMLLDEWFENRLVHLKPKFDKMIEKVKEEKRENGKRTGSANGTVNGTISNSAGTTTK